MAVTFHRQLCHILCGRIRDEPRTCFSQTLTDLRRPSHLISHTLTTLYSTIFACS